MRIFLALVLAIGVFAGAVGRAAAHAFPHHHLACQSAGCESVDEDCCESSSKPAACGLADQAHAGGSDEDSGSKTPEHHHHHICCVMSPIALGDESVIVFRGVDGVRAPFAVEHQTAPDGPVFELELPPLI